METLLYHITDVIPRTFSAQKAVEKAYKQDSLTADRKRHTKLHPPNYALTANNHDLDKQEQLTSVSENGRFIQELRIQR